jgi:hypothetical protein
VRTGPDRGFAPRSSWRTRGAISLAALSSDPAATPEHRDRRMPTGRVECAEPGRGTLPPHVMARFRKDRHGQARHGEAWRERATEPAFFSALGRLVIGELKSPMRVETLDVRRGFGLTVTLERRREQRSGLNMPYDLLRVLDRKSIDRQEWVFVGWMIRCKEPGIVGAIENVAWMLFAWRRLPGSLRSGRSKRKAWQSVIERDDGSRHSRVRVWSELPPWQALASVTTSIGTGDLEARLGEMLRVGKKRAPKMENEATFRPTHAILPRHGRVVLVRAEKRKSGDETALYRREEWFDKRDPEWERRSDFFHCQGRVVEAVMWPLSDRLVDVVSALEGERGEDRPTTFWREAVARTWPGGETWIPEWELMVMLIERRLPSDSEQG